MNRNLILALLMLVTLAAGLLAFQAAPAAEAATCDPEIPCGCCEQGCYDAYDACIAGGTSQSVCAAQEQSCLRNCRFCV